MTQENINNQEDVKTESGPKPFDPKDEARKAELEAKFEGKKEQLGPNRFTVKNGTLSVSIDGFFKKEDGFIRFKAAQVDRNDTTTDFKGGFSRDINYAVGKRGDTYWVQKIYNPGGAEFVQDVRGDEAEAVLKSSTVAKYLN